MKKLLILILLLTGLAGVKADQIRKIKGTVYRSDDKQPIPGASVKIKGTNTGTVTNATGKFELNVPDNAELIVSFIGYTSQSVNIRKKDSLSIYLLPSSNSLNEVVVVGYGIQRRKDITGSVSTINKSYKSSARLNRPLPGLTANNAGMQVSAPVVNQSLARGRFKPGQIVTSNPQTDESYKAINENAFVNPLTEPLSTFSADVDAASYSNIRRFINNGQMPPPDAVRIEEVINYFKYNLSGPADDSPVAIHTELSTAPWNNKHRLLRIGLKAKTVNENELPPSNLVFLLDVSGSMADENKLPLVKASMKMLADQLRPKDKVAIVVYSGQAGLILGSTSGDEKETIKDAIDGLNAGGSTAGGAGIKLAYKIARENYIDKGNNRIIMATDGDFNVGDSSDGDMEQLITRERDSKVALSILGFGMGNLKDSKMEVLADKGNGNYAYIDNITEAHKALVSEFSGTLFTIAKDVKIQVEFNPAKVQAYRLLGYEDRLLNKEDFNNDRKDAGDMGSGHAVTALYEIVPAGIKDDYAGSVDPLKYQKTQPPVIASAGDEMLTIKFRYKDRDDDKSKLRSAIVKDIAADFNNTSADYRFAAAVAEFGMLLRHSQYKQTANYNQVISLAKAARGRDDDGYRAEFVRLAESVKSLAKNDLVIAGN